MSFGVDVNLLLYASDASSARHAESRLFVERCLDGPEVCCFAWQTLMSYVRLATHPAISAKPLSHRQAVADVQRLLAPPHVRTVVETDSFWPAYLQISAVLPLRGKLVPDAHLAAIMQCNGIKTLYTHDRDFRRFPFLDVRDPLG